MGLEHRDGVDKRDAAVQIRARVGRGRHIEMEMVAPVRALPVGEAAEPLAGADVVTLEHELGRRLQAFTPAPEEDHAFEFFIVTKPAI